MYLVGEKRRNASKTVAIASMRIIPVQSSCRYGSAAWKCNLVGALNDGGSACGPCGGRGRRSVRPELLERRLTRAKALPRRGGRWGGQEQREPARRAVHETERQLARPGDGTEHEWPPHDEVRPQRRPRRHGHLQPKRLAVRTRTQSRPGARVGDRARIAGRGADGRWAYDAED